MPSRIAISHLVCALTGLALTGCYTPYRYAPYNPYGAGVPMYGPQGMPVQPQFAPQGGTPTLVDPNGSTFGPGNTGGSFSSPQIQPTPDPAAGGSFPSTNNGIGSPPANNGGFDPSLPSTPGGSNGGSSGLVPNAGYGDANNLVPPATNGGTGGGSFGGGNSTPFGPDGASFQQNPPGESVSQVRYEQAANRQELQLTAHQPATNETYAVVNAFAEDPQPFTTTPPANKPNPYGHDAIGYRWLRGLVDFDERQKAWVLIYNPSPGPQDAYRGQITLIDNGQLQTLQNNDVVLVEGQVDPAFRDPGTGKPQFRIQKLHGPLAPKF